MAYVFFDATLDLARTLGDVFESTATGGTTETLVDTKIFQTSGFWSDDPRGTLWLKLSTKASKQVTSHSTTTVTFSPAQGSVVAANDSYAIAPGIYPKYALEQAVKMGLKEIGRIPHETTHAAVANQESYTSDDNAVYDKEITGIEVANAASASFNWTPHYRWHQVPSTSRKLVYDEGTAPSSTNPVRVYYLDEHTEPTADTSVISTYINPERLRWAAAIHALRWRIQRTKQDDPAVPALLSEAKEMVAGMAATSIEEARTRVAEMAALQLAEAETMYAKMSALYPIARQQVPRHARW